MELFYSTAHEQTLAMVGQGGYAERATGNNGVSTIGKSRPEANFDAAPAPQPDVPAGLPDTGIGVTSNWAALGVSLIVLRAGAALRFRSRKGTSRASSVARNI
jgi:LPXTG-motif cell wall-anchored protein